MGDYPQLDPALITSHAVSIEQIQLGSLALAAVAVILMICGWLRMNNHFKQRLEFLFMRHFSADSSLSRCLTALQEPERQLRKSRQQLEQSMLTHIRKRNTADAVTTGQQLDDVTDEFCQSYLAVQIASRDLKELGERVTKLLNDCRMLEKELSEIAEPSKQEKKYLASAQERNAGLRALAQKIRDHLQEHSWILLDARNNIYSYCSGDTDDENWLIFRFVDLQNRLKKQAEQAGIK